MRQAWLQEADDEGDEGEEDEDEDEDEDDVEEDGEGHAEGNEGGKEGDGTKKADMTSSKQKVQTLCRQHMQRFVCYHLLHVFPDNLRSKQIERQVIPHNTSSSACRALQVRRALRQRSERRRKEMKERSVTVYLEL